MNKPAITTLFLDVGGVIATNGWDHKIRQKVIQSFGLDYVTIEQRHPSFFELFECGKITFDQYLDWVIFYEKRVFSKEEFKERVFAESVLDLKMINYLQKVKAEHKLHIVIISNEGRELADYRIKKFELNKLADTLIFSGFVGMRKPDFNIYRLALDLSQTPAEQVLYIDDRPLLVDVAKSLGIHGLPHQSIQKSVAILNSHGLELNGHCSLGLKD